MKRWHCSLARLLFLAALGAAVLLAHLADGYAWCQEYWNWDGKRNSKDGRRWPAEDGVVITYINGIFHSVPEWESITNQLQAIFGHEVRPFYNPSSGWWITDASKATYHLLRKPANDTVAQALGEHLGQAVDDVGKGRVLHIAHSGGALITYLAAQHHLTERQRDKIDVLTFGGARSITRKYFSGRVVNYYARNDPLVKLDRRAAELMKLTSNTKFQEVSEKHNTTFVFLEGRARQFVLDHSLEGPTYQHALRKEAKAFRRAHFGPLSPLSWDYDFSLLRLVRKKAAGLSGMHNFFSTETFGARSFRKVVARLTGFHGFFSGKKPTTGVQIAVIGEGPESSHDYEEGGFLGTVRRWWPWAGDRDGAGLLTPAGEPPGGGGGYERDPGSRFWLGFRWFSDARRGEGLEDDESAPSFSTSVSVGDSGDSSADGDGEGAQAVSRSRWEQVQHFWAFGREEASSPGGSGTEPPEGGGGGGVAQEATDGEGEKGPPREEGKGEGGSMAEQAPERRWLSVGWTPWGAAPKPDGEPGAFSGQEGGGGGGESPADPGGEGEREEEGEGGGEGEVLGKVLEGQTPLEEPSYLRRWWPASSARGVEPEAVAPEARSGGEPGPDGEGGGEGEEEMGAVVEGQPVPEESGYLKRWWPTSPAREKEVEETTPSAGSVGGAELEEAICVEGEGGEGEGGEGEVGGDKGLGQLLEAQPPPEEQSYLQRWWPASSARGVEEAVTPAADSVAHAALQAVTATERPEGEEGEGNGEDKELGQLLDAQTLPKEPSYLQRWWPASSAREVEGAVASPASDVCPVALGQEGEEGVTPVGGGGEEGVRGMALGWYDIHITALPYIMFTRHYYCTCEKHRLKWYRTGQLL